MNTELSVREIQEKDIESIADYFLNADEALLTKMGVLKEKIPPKDFWIQFHREQISRPYEKKEAYFIIWESDGKAVGHSNANKIIFGEQAYMHLHIWNDDVRRKGMGTEFVRKTVDCYFKNLQLKKLYCEPNAFNDAPNKTLEKAGFRFIKTHNTTPGWLNFEQSCNLWEMQRLDQEGF
jgi:RimJ/RimL family protein N-acetyltransferase